MNTRRSVVLLLIGLAFALSGTTLGQSPPPAAPCFYTEAQLTELLTKTFAHPHWQRDKSEKLVLITANGQVFAFRGGSGDPRAISINLGKIIGALTQKGQSLGTVTNVIHNHFDPQPEDDFSSADITGYETLRKHGFTGKFQIFYPRTGKIKTLKRKE